MTTKDSFEAFVNIVHDKIDKFSEHSAQSNLKIFQSELKNLQNKRNILFCGSYFGYGFHEDGIKSSIEMLKNIND